MNSWFEISLTLKLKRFKQIFQIFKIFWMREMTLQIFGSWPEIFADVSLWTEVERSRRLAWIWNFLFYGRLVAKLGGCSSGQKFTNLWDTQNFPRIFTYLGKPSLSIELIPYGKVRLWRCHILIKRCEDIARSNFDLWNLWIKWICKDRLMEQLSQKWHKAYVKDATSTRLDTTEAKVGRVQIPWWDSVTFICSRLREVTQR